MTAFIVAIIAVNVNVNNGIPAAEPVKPRLLAANQPGDLSLNRLELWQCLVDQAGAPAAVGNKFSTGAVSRLIRGQKRR